MLPKNFLIIGGDRRQAYAANTLCKSGDGKIFAAAIPKELLDKEIIISDDIIAAISISDYIVLPIEKSADAKTVHTPLVSCDIKMEEIAAAARKGTLITGGRVSQRTREIFAKRGHEIQDYLKREELAVLNAIPTAEGALMLALRESGTTIWGSKVLIAGFGRVGKACARLFIAMGADVTVLARSHEDLAWAKLYGAGAVSLKSRGVDCKNSEIIINTIPTMIFDREALSELKKGTVIIDLASVPGGVDLDSAEDFGINATLALSLPGKVAPVTSGEIIAQTILNIISEMR